ncbi:hypothetical protein MMC21_006445 [Puttea exsequens]|nr:hypothetical protein [Puttea exsequens]
MSYNVVAQVEPDDPSESGHSHHSSSPLEASEDLQRIMSQRSGSRSRTRQTDAIDHPRTVSREGSVLRHPTPDLQSLQGAYISNIERLEQSAERLSISGSDIGEELRKIRMEQKRTDSRQSSILNSPGGYGGYSPSLSRQPSYGFGSHASHSIVETNNVARSGGFSPAAYFASPRNSVRSGSWSHHSSVKEKSSSYEPRLRQVSEPEQEGKPLDSPISTRFIPASQPEPLSSPLHVMNDARFNLDHVNIPHTESSVAEPADAAPEPEPRSSTDTYRQVRTLFTDFDGTHAEDQLHDNSDLVDPSRLPSEARPVSFLEPTPTEDMVFYPAPVPMMLNLPKRLSRLPTAPHREKRRTQLIGSLPVNARKSAAWLPDTMNSTDGVNAEQEMGPRSPAQTSKRRTMADAPPQLRATMFFDQPSLAQEVQVKGESAMDTLDSILDASAFAPVSAFTDHPLVGHLGAEVYGKTPVKSRASIMPLDAKDPRKRTSSLNLLTKRTSSSNLPEHARKRSSTTLLTNQDSSANTLEDVKKRNSSLLSLANFGRRKSSGKQLEISEEHDGASLHDEQKPLQDGIYDPEVAANFHDVEEREAQPGDEMDEVKPEEEFSGQPTTLLAELQMRKQQQKQRNRPAATAFPNGMQSTLLQLDAVAQVQRQARKQKRTMLAWEDPEALQGEPRDREDDDVPLGMLFPKRNMEEVQRRFDEDRPLGLIARRDMEDNEPLSHRRARLRGEYPSVRTASPEKGNSMYTLNRLDFDQQNPPPDNEEEHETLGQRLRRLKATQIPVQARPVSDDFASEMMSQLGVASPPEQPAQVSQLNARTNSKTPELEEETLGQRRKRLQAEASKARQLSSDSNEAAVRPPMSKRRSMADILQAHPAAGAGTRPFSNEIKFAPAPKTRNTAWAINQTRQASMGQVPMASGVGVKGQGNVAGYGPHPMMEKGVEVDVRQRDMIDRWRQSIMY